MATQIRRAYDEVFHLGRGPFIRNRRLCRPQSPVTSRHGHLEDTVQSGIVHRTMLGDGLATSLASFMGGPPNTTYSEVTGAVALTRDSCRLDRHGDCESDQ